MAGYVSAERRVLDGRYELRELIGVGGMATVWRAHDRVLGREVAVKLLREQYAEDPSFVARFHREAQHAAGITHPRLVTVFDSGVDGDTPFIVMELLTGRTLRTLLDERGAMPSADAIGVAVGICEALEVAHAAGLVHRDIKPANILLSDAGQVKVTDFGIARAEGGDSHTRTTGVLGTAAYLAPEQASGHRAGPQADLYALGCVLYEMLTGRPPFTADTPVGLAYRQVHEAPQPPSQRRRSVPPDLDALTLQLLSKEPTARPPGAAATRAELLALEPDAAAPASPTRRVAGSPPTARLPTNFFTTSRWNGIRLLALGEAILIVALLAFLLADSGSPRPVARTTPPAPRPHTSASPRTPTRSPAVARAPATPQTALSILRNLILTDQATGAIDQQAAGQLLQSVDNGQAALDQAGVGPGGPKGKGGPHDQAPVVQNLENQLQELSQHGDIQAGALPGLTQAVATLRTALDNRQAAGDNAN